MAKFYGQRCGPLNNCGEYGGPGWMCECDGQGNCTEQGVGDPGQFEAFAALSPKEFQAHMEASTTKFYGTYTEDGGLKLMGVGMLKEAGLQVGDILIGAFVVGDNTLEMSNQEHRQRILEWKFTKPLVSILFKRGDLSLSSTMKNPAAKP